jgi:hypothetical protein
MNLDLHPGVERSVQSRILKTLVAYFCLLDFMIMESIEYYVGLQQIYKKKN